ncbi:hypothetical protein DMUE_3008 [Dictyocoela muelleri]|nr:hypothetical protein DMUE_3008 [Dictyocoela muelleri]
MTKFKIIKSQLGKDKIIFDGYIYVFDQKKIKNLSWRCSTHSCTRRICTDFDKTNVIISKNYFHERETNKITRLILNKTIKDTAINTQTPFGTTPFRTPGFFMRSKNNVKFVRNKKS